MAAAASILKNFNAFLNGIAYPGNAKEVQLPDLKILEVDYRAGGMDGTIKLDMGMEAMEASFTLTKYDGDALATFGLAEGQDIPFTFRGAVESLDGSMEAVEVHLSGKINGVAVDAVQAGQSPGTKYTMAVRYYFHSIDGRVIHEIDVINMKRIIDGVDQVAAQRAAIGL